MRIVFLALLLLNLVLLAWGQGYFGGWDAGRESERLGRQVDPEKLGIVSVASPSAESASCKRIEGLEPAVAAEAHKLLAAMPGWQAELKIIKEAAPYLVMIPDLPGPTVAQRKLGELRKMGVEEGVVAEYASGMPYIMLKSFSGVRAAEEYLNGLIQKGVRSARIVPGDSSEKAVIEVRVPSAELARKLEEVLAPMRTQALIDCPVT